MLLSIHVQQTVVIHGEGIQEDNVDDDAVAAAALVDEGVDRNQHNDVAGVEVDKSNDNTGEVLPLSILLPPLKMLL
jgi:hypothetical protein